MQEIRSKKVQELTNRFLDEIGLIKDASPMEISVALKTASFHIETTIAAQAMVITLGNVIQGK